MDFIPLGAQPLPLVVAPTFPPHLSAVAALVSPGRRTISNLLSPVTALVVEAWELAFFLSHLYR